ncbi:cupredoxin domain-containing protein [Microbulbifer variabilis]|uniref:cupredoxin domain-containing protein n=1 Tax=Microbulbifer variabilis TaxID=266805 RepID=UPI00299D7109|nr:cupredoxin domain-containing protein [Microbulbifer variabilis]
MINLLKAGKGILSSGRITGCLWLLIILLGFPLLNTCTSDTDKPTVKLEIRNHLFNPSEVAIPADTEVKLVIYNRDSSPEEFESYLLNRKKVIMGNSKAVIFIGPLPAGEYPFFGEFHPKTAQGKIIAQ